MPNNLKRTVREGLENSPRSNPNDRVPGEQTSPISVQNLNIRRVAPWNVRQGEGVQPSLPFTPPIRLRKQPKGSRELRQLLPLTHQSREHRPPGGGPRAFSQAMNSGIRRTTMYAMRSRRFNLLCEFPREKGPNLLLQHQSLFEGQ